MKKGLKITLITIAIVIALIIAFVGAYVGYIFASYNRIGDIDLTINSGAELTAVDVGSTYKISTYNIGFGAYSQDYTFFLDTGYDDEGNATCGHWSKGRSKEEVEFNTNGAINAIKALDADFMLFQEVDTKSTRSYKINQNQAIIDAFQKVDNVHAVNFHSAYLPYPLYDMHGSVNAGLTILSKYKMQSARRYQYTIADDFSKLFDLDRCFAVTAIKVSNDKTLYIVDSHMSAYDEGGTIRQKQMEELNAFLKKCQDEGAYVIIGGDFNHDLLTNNPKYSYTSENRPFGMTKKAPDWVAYMFDENGKSPIMDGYTIYAANNNPTCRNNDIEWTPGETFVCTVDGYIVSDNIDVVTIEAIQTKQGKKGIDGFAFADHEPVYMEFKLK